MAKKKVSPIEVLTNHVETFVDSEGVEQERVFATRGKFDKTKCHPGGSAWIGYVNLCIAILLGGGEKIILTLQDLKCRIRVDGTLVFEPKDENRCESLYPRTGPNAGEEVRGAMVFDLIGGDSRTNLAEEVAAQYPPLNKAVKKVRAELARRAA